MRKLRTNDLQRALRLAAAGLLAWTVWAQRIPPGEHPQSSLNERLDNSEHVQPACEAAGKPAEISANTVQQNLDLAVCWLKKDEFGKALPYVEAAVKKLSGTRDAAYPYYLRAKAESGQNEIQKAAADLEKAVSLEPSFAAAWSDLGLARKTLLDTDGALAAYKRAVESDPDDGVAQYRLGSEYLHQGESHRAVQHLREARRLEPLDQSTLNSLQLALRQDGQTAEADRVRKELTELLRRRDILYQNALKAITVNNDGATLEKAGNLVGAVQKYRAALELDPGQVRIRVNLAIALLRLGHWNEGLSELRKAIRSDPENERLRRAWADAISQAPAGTNVDGLPLNTLGPP